MRDLVRRSSSSAALLSLAMLLAAGPAAAAEPDEACPRLSAPPSYGSPVVGQIDSRLSGVFRVVPEPGTAPWLLYPRLTDDGSWELTRLVVTGPDQVRPRPLASLAHRAARDEVVRVFAGDVNGDGWTDLLLYWDINYYDPDEVDLLLGGAEGFTVEADVLPLEEGEIWGAVFGDFDGDGADELAWRWSAQWGRILLHGYQPGAGFSPILAKQLLGPRSLEAMDVNSDGIDDLVHVERLQGAGLLYVHFGDAQRPLDLTETRRLRHRPVSVHARKGGNPGPAEIVILQSESQHGALPRLRMTALSRLNPNYWTRTWSERLPEDYNRAPESWDMDRDGHDDFFFRLGDYYRDQDGFQILRYREGEPYEPMHRSEGRSRLLDVQPVDDDEIPDALVLGIYGTMSRFAGIAPLRFDEGRTFWKTDYDTRRHVGFGDLDEDGLEDVIATVDLGELVWWRSLGGGEYESVPIMSPPGRPGMVWVADLDGDSHQDVAVRSYFFELGQYALFVGWGDGSGWPASWRPAQQGRHLWEHVFADVEGDGDVDLLAREFRSNDWRDGSDLQVFVNQGRSFRLADSQFLPPYDKGGGLVHLAAADIDGDGVKDVLHYANDPRDRAAGRLVWRPGSGEGRLGEARALLERSLSGFPTFVPTDVDRDGDVDLVVIDDCRGDGKSVRVLGNDGGSFRPFWTGPESNDCPKVALVDVNGDGLLDLHEQGSVRPRFRVWTADGTGGFDPVGDGDGFFVGERTEGGGGLAHAWGAVGPDHVLVTDWTSQASGVISVPQRTGRLDRDVAAPEVSLQLVPEVDTFGEVDEFGGAWRVSARAVDECTLTEVTRVSARTPELDPGIPARFALDSTYEVRVYESLEGGGREVVLRGPDEATARDLFARMLAQGGFELEPNAFVKIQTYDEWGRPPQDLDDQDLVTLSAARLTHAWRLERGELRSVRVHRPGADVTFDVAAVDGTGKRATATGTYQQQRQRYCAEHPGQDTVCD